MGFMLKSFMETPFPSAKALAWSFSPLCLHSHLRNPVASPAFGESILYSYGGGQEFVFYEISPSLLDNLDS